MKKLTLATCVLGIAVLALGEDMVENPAYLAWAQFKPGTMVKLERTIVFKVAGEESSSTTLITQTLKEVTPEKAVVEVTEGGNTTQQDIKAKAAKAATQPAGMTRKAEGDEEIEVLGKKYQAHWVEYVASMGLTRNIMRIWTVKEVPGGTAKIESVIEQGPGEPKTTTKILEFKLGGGATTTSQPTSKP